MLNLISSKSKLAIELSRLNGFENPKLLLEQYPLDSETASLILWTAFLNQDIEGKVIADLGSGPGILAKGCLLLGAGKVYLVEKDPEAIKISKQNIKGKKAVFINQDIKDFNKQVDTVIQNPPFGTKTRHADKIFLEKAMLLSSTIYSLHKITSKGFISALAHDNQFTIQQIIPIKMQLKPTYRFHQKPKKQIELGLWVLKKKKILKDIS